MKKQDRPVLKSILIVFLSLVAFLIIIAMIVKVDEYKKSSYKVDVKFATNDIVQLNNKLPISDSIGKNYNGVGIEKGIADYKEFTVTNPNEGKVNYEIYLTKIHGSVKDIRSNYIKLYLTDDKNSPLKGFDKNVIKSYYDLYALSDKPGSRLLYKDSLVAGGSKKYILRCWLADTYVLSNIDEGFSFDIDVRIK